MKMMRALFLGVFFLLFALGSPLAQAHSAKGFHTKSGKIEALKNKLKFHRKKCSGKIPTPEPATLFGPPEITRLELPQGPENGGSLIVISGANFATDPLFISPPFADIPSVFFGDVAAINVIPVDFNTILARSPPGKGTVDVSVRTSKGTSQDHRQTKFTYINFPTPPPEIKSIHPLFVSERGSQVEPHFGYEGVIMVIEGLNFRIVNPIDKSVYDQCVVFVGNQAYIGYPASNTTLWGREIPPGNGTVPVQVTTSAGTSIQDVFLTYTEPVSPVITSVSPNAGPADDDSQVVAITGSNLDNVTQVYFGDEPGYPYWTSTKTTLSVLVPPHAAGPVLIRLESLDGDAESTFTFLPNPPLAPVIEQVQPTHLPLKGGPVTIVGKHFDQPGGVEAFFAGGPGLDLEVITDNIIQVTAPPFEAIGASSSVFVSTIGGSSDAYGPITHGYPFPPLVTQISPDKGSMAGGTTVTITGEHFRNVKNVYFGGVAAADFNVDSDKTIFALAPAGEGTVDVRVSTATEVSRLHYHGRELSYKYTYTPAPPSNAPEIRAIRPNTGPEMGGSRIVIQGVHFDREVSITFGENDLPAREVFFNSPQLLTVVTPPGGIEPFGTVVHAITQEGGRSAASLASRFTYHNRTAVQSASVSSVSPDEGIEGEPITIYGSGFLAGVGGVEVFFGAAPAEEITILSDSMMKVVVPPKRSNNTVNVWVTTSAGTTDKSLAAKFTYVVP